jgi:hypothetical protein
VEGDRACTTQAVAEKHRFLVATAAAIGVRFEGAERDAVAIGGEESVYVAFALEIPRAPRESKLLFVNKKPCMLWKS